MRSPTSSSFRTSVLCTAIAVCVSALSLWLRARVPVPIGLSGVDDMLFIRNATSLVNGAWLGPFDDLTLAKGPSYPIFIATMHTLGVPLKLAEQATYLLACLFVAGGLHLAMRRLMLSTVVFSGLALNPVNFSDQSAALLRDNWHASLSLLLPAVVFVTLFMAMSGFRMVWVVLTSLFAGVVGAAFWMCREEGISIAPTIAIIVIGLPLLRLGRWRSLPSDSRFSGVARRRTIGYATATVAIAVGLLLPMAAVSALNERHYGVALINDWSTGAFAQVYADWTRVGGGSREFWVPLTHQQRALVYRVSPAARELEPFLESADSPYANMSCKAPNCDFPGSFTGWELRLAAMQAGHYTSGSAAQEFFGRLDAEIVAGCDSGALNCTDRLPAALQPLQRTTVPQLAASFGTILRNVVLSVDLFDAPTQFWPDPTNRLPVTAPVVDGIPTDQDAAANQAAHFAATIWPYDVLGWMYRVAIPVLSVLALIAVLGGWIFFRWPSTATLLMAAALLVGFLSRSALLAIVDTTDFNATVNRYQLASQMMLTAFAVLGSAALFEWGRRVLQVRKSARAASSTVRGPTTLDAGGHRAAR